MIIATAGHIDHGKSTLVRALTGVDTDRLPEEKARGISIDLGFAYLHGDGGLMGFVDVPGHERFVRNMLAGVAAIDAALLVVAADDSVMPQTREHLQILDLLGVRRGIAAVTKVDRVNEDGLRAVIGDVGKLLAGTSLQGMPVMPVSSTSGEGLEALRRSLTSLVRTHRPRLPEGRLFRLAVDRAFNRPGTGTVVTGAVFDGIVRLGDRLVVSPVGHDVRVRGIQIRGIPATTAQAGDRCALALAGVAAGQATRGDWIVDPCAHSPTQQLDVKLRLLGSEPTPLSHWTRVQVHCGTASIPARVALAAARTLVPGSQGHARLVLERPLAAVVGDRYILRDQAARRTIGGGVVLDPFPSRRRAGPDRERVLAVLENGKPADALQAMLDCAPAAVDRMQYRRMFNLTDVRVADLTKACKATVLGRDRQVIVPLARLATWRSSVLDQVDAAHREDPRASGLDVAILHESVAKGLPAEAFTSFLRGLADAGSVAMANGQVSRRHHDTTANAADEALWARVASVLGTAGFNPPTLAQLAAGLQADERELADLLHRKAKAGEVCRIGLDRFYPRATIVQLAAIVVTLAKSRQDGLFTAAEYRDATRVGRTLGIRILEFFDGAGITRRTGDARRVLRDPAPMFENPRKPMQPQARERTQPET